MVEVKERDVAGNRSQRLDILVCNGNTLPAFGFELVVAATKEQFDEHCMRAEQYGKLHNCQMFMVNLCPKAKLSRYFGCRQYNLTPVNVVFDRQLVPGTVGTKGIIKYHDGDTTVSINGSQWEMLFRSN
ncbi:hypothetical protein BGZ76_007268 [Entomortierella beljakovae]|nr:hypothetical protein BGZ76_007268 [Entomortierella beljakovae]